MGRRRRKGDAACSIRSAGGSSHVATLNYALQSAGGMLVGVASGGTAIVTFAQSAADVAIPKILQGSP